MSADLKAAGMDTDLNTDNSAPSLTLSEGGEMSSDSEAESSTSIDHTHEEFGHGKGHNRAQDHSDDYDVLGLLTDDKIPSELSAVSIDLRSHESFYDNVNNNESI